MSDTSGPTSQQPFAYYDPDGCCWRTSQATFDLGLTEPSPTLPTSGSMRNGSLYRRPGWERHISATDSSCSPGIEVLPTPRASKHEEGAQTFLERSQRLQQRPSRNGGPTGMPLGVAVELLPTPTTDDAGNAMGRGSGDYQPPASTICGSRPETTQDVEVDQTLL